MKNYRRIALAFFLVTFCQLLSGLGHSAADSATTYLPLPSNAAQQPSPLPTPEDSVDDVVRVTTNLIQIDVVVTDKQGNRVENLQPEDFEILVNKRPQPITNFSFISDTPTPVAEKRVARPKARPSKIPPARPKGPADVRRTSLFVIDNLCSSLESTNQARDSVRKFINEQMEPNDLVAVIQTIGGTGTLQQFTSDKRLLLAAVNGVRFNSSSARRRRVQCGGDEPVQLGSSQISDVGLADPSAETFFASGRLATLNMILRGLKEIPGRKSLILLTDNLPYPSTTTGEGNQSQIMNAYSRLIDFANRASTVIYTIDLRGLATLGFDASNAGSGLGVRGGSVVNAGPMFGRDISRARSEFYYSKTGMSTLARETGGFFVENTNNISGGLRRAADDSNRYYLIGFRPDDKFFERPNQPHFNQLQVRVKRPGLTVRTRKGFFGFADTEVNPAARTRQQKLDSALISPFAATGIPLTLTSIFSAETPNQPAVSSLIHVDAATLNYSEEADGWRKAVVDIVAVLFDSNGTIVEQVNRTETVQAKSTGLEQLLRSGLVYVMHVPVKKPGVYQSRVVVRDASTDKLGGASQIIEVPNLTDGKLNLSGIVLQGSTAQSGSGAKIQKDAAAAARSNPGNPSGPVLRRFQRGAEVEYYFFIYNAKVGPDGRPQLQKQIRLFRDGKVVFTGPSMPYDPGRQTDFKQLAVGARLTLGKDLLPGDYVLEVNITDLLAPEKSRTASEALEFKIVE
jgi:VWFA-related protein